MAKWAVIVPISPIFAVIYRLPSRDASTIILCSVMDRKKSTKQEAGLWKPAADGRINEFPAKPTLQAVSYLLLV